MGEGDFVALDAQPLASLHISGKLDIWMISKS